MLGTNFTTKYIKISLNEEIYKFPVDISTFTYLTLQQTVLQLFPTAESKDYRICYHDEEDDWITLMALDEMEFVRKMLVME